MVFLYIYITMFPLELEAEASNGSKREKHISPGEAKFVWELIKDHGDNYKVKMKNRYIMLFSGWGRSVLEKILGLRNCPRPNYIILIRNRKLENEPKHFYFIDISIQFNCILC